MNPELNNLIADAQAIAEEAKTVFGNLNAEQLNWKPSPEKWSVGQCFDHLIVTNEKEFPYVEAAIRDDYKNPFWGKVPFLPKFFGNFILKAVNPENVKKQKAPQVFTPTQSTVSPNVVSEFLANQDKAISLMEASEDLDLAKTIIVSPVASFVTYSLSDAYKILVLHERRHFNQARRVMEMQEFPR